MDPATWSSLHPVGTRCTLTLVDGRQLAVVIAGAAVSYGSVILVPLEGLRGLWPVAWIEATAEGRTAPRNPIAVFLPYGNEKGPPKRA